MTSQWKQCRNSGQGLSGLRPVEKWKGNCPGFRTYHPKIGGFKEKGDIQGYLQFVWERLEIARFSETMTAQEVGMPSWYEFAPEELKLQEQ
jgi:hypothetical protein